MIREGDDDIGNFRTYLERIENLIKNKRFIFYFFLLAGCGASYEIIVVADEFAKLRTVNQHRLVSEALSKQLPNIHAIRIFTGTDEKQFIDS
jgi:stress-induced morphogen